MSRALYLTHPEVVIDPSVPTPLWGLSELGHARAQAFAARGLLGRNAVIFSSTERKALELAETIADTLGIRVTADPAFGENDRSSTGYLPAALFEDTADRFFAEPETSVDGWEAAHAAQSRIVTAVGIALASLEPGTIAVFCGHGAVGTLLKCHCGQRAIARSEDQRLMANPGGGNGFVFDLSGPKLYCDWQDMADLGPIESYGAIEPLVSARP